MASILNVDQINNAAGTSAVTIDASTGKASFPNGVTLPAGVGGKLLNTATLNAPSQLNVSSGYAFIDGWTVNYTPVSATSTLHFVITTPTLAESSNRMDVRMFWRGANQEDYLTLMDASGVSGWQIHTSTLVYTVSSGGTSQGALKLTLRSNGEGTTYLNYSYAESNVLVMEIAQ
jgi:hypothetical protein